MTEGRVKFEREGSTDQRGGLEVIKSKIGRELIIHLIHRAMTIVKTRLTQIITESDVFARKNENKSNRIVKLESSSELIIHLALRVMTIVETRLI